MTLAPNRTYTMTIERLAQRAMVRSGLVDASVDFGAAHFQPELQMCREHLQETLSSLLARGVSLRYLIVTEITTTAAVQEYTLDSEVLDVLGDAKWVDANNTETLVRQVNVDRWEGLTDRTLEGRPSLVYAERQAPIVLKLWPTPSEGGTLRLQLHEQPRDAVYGQYEVDLEPYWHAYLTYTVAGKYALDKGLDAKAGLLLQLADTELPYALNKSQNRVAQSFYNSHDPGWYR